MLPILLLPGRSKSDPGPASGYSYDDATKVFEADGGPGSSLRCGRGSVLLCCGWG